MRKKEIRNSILLNQILRHLKIQFWNYELINCSNVWKWSIDGSSSIYQLIRNHKIDTLVVHHPIEHIGFKWPTNQKAVIWIDFYALRFASFLSGGFTTIALINPPERKLAKCNEDFKR